MLTPSQQADLDYHLREVNLLTNEELILELTDHYTVALTEYMTQGMTFETALTEVQKAFGGRKGLQKMEQQYNQVTFRRYDTLFMNYVQQQRKWPHLLVPLLIYSMVYWATTHVARPTSCTVDRLLLTPLGGFALGSTIGLLIQACRFLLQQNGLKRNLSPKAIYVITRFLPINLLLYGFAIALVYWAQLFPPYVYEATLATLAALGVSYMLSYSKFHQSVFKSVQKSD
ncbi:hypothetical protein [Spirosoma aerolatum]|uniref:hypothetical protein n=1 Tax=Spirosoma aerolatum TaxID=1211326 RepID=UPI0009AF21A2|nr:hypothetical protein [Spirosoma aerolatum]